MCSNETNFHHKTKILIDDREVPSGVIKLLSSKANVSIEIKRMSVGDYQVGENLLFERKTFPDLIESIKDGRLFRQGYKLANVPKRGILILEGRSGDLGASAMRREAIQGSLILLTVFFGIPLLRAKSLEETVNLMLYTANQQYAFDRSGFVRKGRRPRGKKAAQKYLLQGMPGIGPKRAQSLLDQFDNVKAVFAAKEEELASVPGIGSETAEKICWALSEPLAKYIK